MNPAQLNVALSALGLPSSRDSLSKAVRPVNTIVLLGDSFVVRDTPAPATGYVNVTPTGIFQWVNYILGQRFYIANFAGVSGNKTDQMLARMTTDVLPYASDYCWIPITVNDIYNSGGAPYPAATTINNVSQMIDICLQNGIIPIVCTTPPNINILDATDVAIWDQVNAWAREVGRRFYDSVIVIEGDWAYLDTSGALPILAQPKAGCTADGVHPSPLGAYDMASVYAAQLDARIPKSYPPFAHSFHASATTDLAIDPNPLNIGTAGTLGAGVTGQVADGLGVRCNGGGSAVCAKVARTDAPGYWQQISYTGDAAFSDAVDNLELYATGTARPMGGLVAGDKIQMLCEFEMDAAPVNFKHPRCGIQFNGVAGEYASFFNPSVGLGNVDKQVVRGVMAPPVRTIPAGTTGYWLSYMAFPSAANASFTVRFGRHVVRKVS